MLQARTSMDCEGRAALAAELVCVGEGCSRDWSRKTSLKLFLPSTPDASIKVDPPASGCSQVTARLPLDENSLTRSPSSAACQGWQLRAQAGPYASMRTRVTQGPTLVAHSWGRGRGRLLNSGRAVVRGVGHKGQSLGSCRTHA